MINHTAYFEALASMEDESSPEWKPTLAGLVVLRLVDDWLNFGAQIVTTDVTGLRAVRQAIADIATGDPIRAILSGIVDAVEQAEAALISTIASHLLAYGKALFYVGQFKLAQDVFFSLREATAAAREHAVMIEAALQLSYILFRSGDTAAAQDAYLFVIQASEAIGDIESQLKGKFGQVHIIVDKGDLPKANRTLEELIQEAREHGFAELVGRGLHHRAVVSALQGDMSASLRLSYQALEYLTDPNARDRALAHVAISFAQLGHLQASRDANLLLAATAQQQEVQWNALVNLMYVAILENQELAFEHYRLLLDQTALPPRMEADYRLDVARGGLKFGNNNLVEKALARARQIAEQHAFNQIIFEIEKFEKEQVAPSQQEDESHGWSAEVASIASAVGEWRQLQQSVSSKKIEGAAV